MWDRPAHVASSDLALYGKISGNQLGEPASFFSSGVGWFLLPGSLVFFTGVSRSPQGTETPASFFVSGVPVFFTEVRQKSNFRPDAASFFLQG